MARRSILLSLVPLLLIAASCTDDDSPAADDTEETTTTTAEPAGSEWAAPPGQVASRTPVPSAGCGSRAEEPVTLARRTLAGTDRWYLMTVPGVHDGVTPLPVVLDFHGLSEGAEVHTRTSTLGAYAEGEGLIAVFPHGTGSPVRWNVEVDRAGNPDLVFVDRLLDELEARLCVDTARVYATGLSNGAMLSSTIACAMSDRFAAVAPVAGIVAAEPCERDRPVPVLAFHGTADAILLFNGGVGDLGRALAGDAATEPLPPADLDGPGYPASAATWAARDGCEEGHVDRDLTPTVVERTWDCPVGAAVTFEIMVGAGHTWPGSEFMASIGQIVGPTDMSIDGTDMIWQFFRRFALPPP